MSIEYDYNREPEAEPVTAGAADSGEQGNVSARESASEPSEDWVALLDAAREFLEADAGNWNEADTERLDLYYQAISELASAVFQLTGVDPRFGEPPTSKQEAGHDSERK